MLASAKIQIEFYKIHDYSMAQDRDLFTNFAKIIKNHKTCDFTLEFRCLSCYFKQFWKYQNGLYLGSNCSITDLDRATL